MRRSSRAFGAVVVGAIAAGVAPAGAAGPAGPGAQAITPGLAATLACERVTLANGIVLILNVDHRAPVVGYDAEIGVGARDDPPGRRGMAALVGQVLLHAPTRHLREKGRDAVREALDAPRWAAEASSNLDATWIEAQAPSGALELLLWMESDRLGFVADGVDLEAVRRAAVEVEQGWGRGVEGRVSEALFGQVWRAAHPYGGASHGALEIAGVTPAEVRERLRRAYGPASTTIVLSGDFDPAQAREMVSRYFGGIAGGARAARAAQAGGAGAAIQGEARVRIEAGVDAPRVAVGWAAPPLYEEDDVLLDVTGRVLAARLQKRLVDGGAAAAVSVQEASSDRGSLFQVRVTAARGHGAGEALAAVDQEIAALGTAGPGEDEVRASRLFWLARMLERDDAPGDRARQIARIAGATGDAGRLALLPGMYAGATVAEVRRVAGAYLSPGRRVVVEVVPTPGAPAEGRVAQGGAP